MTKPRNTQRHDRRKARRGKMTRGERRSQERQRVMRLAEQAGHPHLARMSAEMVDFDARLSEIIAAMPQVGEIRREHALTALKPLPENWLATMVGKVAISGGITEALDEMAEGYDFGDVVLGGEFYRVQKS